jgi:DNA-binding MarR family transcriptional regulator
VRKKDIRVVAAATFAAKLSSVEAATRKISEEQLRTWRAFLNAHSTMLRRISRDLEEAGLPPLTWYDVLAALRDAPDGRLRQVDVAERVLLSHSGLSRLLDRIEAKGLVERVRCPSDRRAINLVLTAEGREMLEQMWPVYARGIADDFLPALGGNRREVAETLERIGAECDAAREAEAETEAAA